MKVLFTYDYGQEKMDAIRALGFDVDYKYEGSLTKEDDLSEYEVLVCYNPFSQIDVSAMKKLKVIQLSSIGFDQLPIDICLEKKITVLNNQGGYSIPMGEWIVMRMLEILKLSHEIGSNQRKHKWKINTQVMELYKKKVVFLGTGTIAGEACKRLQGFDCEIIGLSRSGKAKDYFDDVKTMADHEHLLSTADIVVVTLPSTEETKGYLTVERMKMMRKDAILINVARGDLIDEAGLIALLQEGWFKGVALDVFNQEPLICESELWDIDRVLISSHNSWVSEMRNERRFAMIYDNLQAIKNGDTPRNLVNIERGY